MAVKNRPGAARETLAKQAANTRRGAPGKHFIGETAAQGAAARREERERVAAMAEADREWRQHEAALARPLGAMVADLAVNLFHLARTLVVAPLRVASALLASPG